MIKRLLLTTTLLATFCLPSLAASADTTAAKNKETYLEKTDKEIQDWSAKIKALEEDSKASGAKTRENLDQHMKAVNENLAVARKKWDEISASSEKAWKSLTDGLDNTLVDVKHHYQKAVDSAPAVKTPKKK